jgi:hypothetical protein
MLARFDVLLRDLLRARVAGITSDAQVGFQPPDETWRNEVVTLNRSAINVYLVDLRENRRLRTNARERVPGVSADGAVVEEPSPVRMDCHYLLTAWSPATVTPAVEPALDEHALLYDAAVALVREAPLNPSRVYAPGAAALLGWPARYRDVELPTVVLPVEGFGRLSDFWTTMGQNTRWKPAVHLVATLPLDLSLEVAGPMVTTRFAEYRVTGVPETAETLLQVGGHVVRATVGGDQPVAGAQVQIETIAGVAVRRGASDTRGRFTFERLRAGQYRLRTTAADVGTLARVVDVPSETGEYDLRFP